MLTVIIPTHNPNPQRLRRTMAGLKEQTLPPDAWELRLIDNASEPPVNAAGLDLSWHPNARVVREERLGLTSARLRGFAESSGEIVVLVDDDNVLAPDYLSRVAESFVADLMLGALGGKSVPEFEAPPTHWVREFDGLLALRDLGDAPQSARWTSDQPRSYPLCSPIGAGMALRRKAVAGYMAALETNAVRRAFDRTGTALVSGGDNDLVMSVLEGGYTVSYRPELQLTHLIPASRCTREYLGRLNRAIARSWIRVLALHGIEPWRPIPRATVLLRQIRAALRHAPWRSPAHWVRWQGACGHFEGLAELANHN